MHSLASYLGGCFNKDCGEPAFLCSLIRVFVVLNLSFGGNKNIIMSSFKSSRNTQKKKSGPVGRFFILLMLPFLCFQLFTGSSAGLVNKRQNKRQNMVSLLL